MPIKIPETKNTETFNTPENHLENGSVGELQPNRSYQLSKITLAVIILISLVAGMLGGVYGAINLANRPEIQKLFGTENKSALTNLSSNQKVVVDEDSAVTEVVKKTSPAVVSIVISKKIGSFFPFFSNPSANDSKDLQQVGAGTGFFVSSDGLILTNKHVVSDSKAKYTVITTDGKQYDAQVVAQDPTNDLAVVKVTITNAPHLEFADSAQLELGQHVIAIGNSLGQFQNTVTTGVVSGLSRSIVAGDRTSQEQLEGVIQTDAAINPGNSGGPLLNIAGQVIGVNTAISEAGQLVGFAIPANDAKVALDSYLRAGKIVRPFIGVRYMVVNKAIAGQMDLQRDYGALLVKGDSSLDFAVVPGSPADKAGLKEGDIILEVNGSRVDEDHQLSQLIKSMKPNDKVNLLVFSNGIEKSVTLILGETN